MMNDMLTEVRFVCVIVGASTMFSSPLLSVAVADRQTDATVSRPPPFSSRKISNRMQHAYAGNTSSTIEKLEVGRGKRKQLANLVPKTSKKKKKTSGKGFKENVPQQLASTNRHCLASEEEDNDWLPRTSKTRSAVSSKVTVATQTVRSVPKQIRHSALRNLQIDGGFSQNQMRLMARFFRNESGATDLIEANFEQNLSKYHERLAGFFEETTIVAQIPLSPHPLIICNAVGDLFDFVAQQHGRSIRSIHHGVDSGQGFLKFDATIEFETKVDSSVPDTGRKRVLILAIAPHVKEANSVFSQVYSLLNLPVDLHFHSFHSDFKAIAFATGIDGGSCSHPCPYCEVRITVLTSLVNQLTAAKLRTCAGNRRYFKKFRKSTSKTAAFDNRNCTADPLSIYPQSTPIISWCRFPELHIHLHLNWYVRRMEHLLPAVAEWYLSFNQTRSEYHGGDFQGPQLRRLTQRDCLASLKNLLTTRAASKEVHLYFNAMCAFVTLKQSCFSTVIDDDGYHEPLAAYKAACLLLPIKKVPLKMHVTVAHLDRALRETGRGLGADSEQSLESAHTDFETVWNRYRVRDMTSGVYSKHLRGAVTSFNASHIPV